jgi:hypothetical protein
MLLLVAACSIHVDRDQALENCRVVGSDAKSITSCLIMKYDWNADEALSGAQRALHITDSLATIAEARGDSLERSQSKAAGVEWERFRSPSESRSPAIALLSSDSVRLASGEYAHGQFMVWCDRDDKLFIALQTALDMAPNPAAKLYLDGEGQDNLAPGLLWSRVTNSTLVSRNADILRLHFAVSRETLVQFIAMDGGKVLLHFHVAGFDRFAPEFDDRCPAL